MFPFLQYIMLDTLRQFLPEITASAVFSQLEETWLTANHVSAALYYFREDARIA